MKKYIFLLLALVLLGACTKSDPWIGEWKPTKGQDDGIIEFIPNGAIVYNQQSEDGSVLLYGVWKKISDEKREVKFKFDSSTVKITSDNPLQEIILYKLVDMLCTEEITFQFSEDYKIAYVKGKEAYIKISSGSGKFDNVKPKGKLKDDTVSQDTVSQEAVSQDTVSQETPEDTAVADLYRCYYSEEMISGRVDYRTYSDEMKKTFSSKGINSSIKEPFSKEFQALIKRVEDVERKYEDLIIDYDLQWGGQGDVEKFNIVVTDVEVKDKDHVLIKTRFTNFNTHPQDFLMVRENGVFKIDDIINDGSLRSFLLEEIKRVEQYAQSSIQ